MSKAKKAKWQPTRKEIRAKPADQLSISLCNSRCPLCGAALFGKSVAWQIGGHLHTENLYGLDHVFFAACPKHFAEAERATQRIRAHETMGYQGEWEPRFGLAAEVNTYDGAGRESCQFITIF